MMEVQMMNGKKYFIYDQIKDVHEDQIAIRMMEHNEIKGLLPFRYMQIDQKRYFRYEAQGETLEEWLERTHNRQEVMSILESLFLMSEEIEAYLLPEGQVCIDRAFVIVEENHCRLAYIPVDKIEQTPILELMRFIIFSVKYMLDDDFGYIFDLQNAFGRKDIQSLSDLKKWLRIVNGDRNGIDIPYGQIKVDEQMEAAQASEVSSVLPNKDKAEFGSVHVEQKDGLEAIFGDVGIQNKKKDKHVLFSRKRKKLEENDKIDFLSKKSIAEEGRTLERKEIINELERGDSTVMVGNGGSAILVSKRNGMEYCLIREGNILGTSVDADIIVQGNPSVSRKHARIFEKNGSFYMEDLGSTNGTWVNGEKLRKNEPYKLLNNAKVKCANEEYIFEAGGEQ